MQNRKSALLAAVLGLLGLTGAQPLPAQGNTPPPDLPARPFVLSQEHTRTLPNGLKIVVIESHSVPTVTLRLGIRAGSVLDPADSPGLAAAVAGQMTSGTDKFNSLQLQQALDGLGGSLSVSADRDATILNASALSENFNRLTEIAADVLLHPTFPADELATAKQRMLQSLVLQRTQASFLATQEFNKVIYGQHPYSVSTTTPAAVQALSPEGLRAFYQAHYTPRDAVLVVVGAVKPAAAFAQLTKTLAAWSAPTATTAAATYPAPPVRAERRIYLVDRPGSVQSNIVIGNLAIKRGDPDYYPLMLTDIVLGGGFSSRLFASVRERLGYAYDVSATLDRNALAGDFNATAQTRTDVTAPAVKEMLRILTDLQTNPVTETELKEAKSYLKGVFVLGLVTQEGLAASVLSRELYGQPADYLATFRSRIDAVTAADMQRVAQKYLLADRSAIIIVGDAGKLRDPLKEIGEVEEVK